jgi:glycosyltransferase involved in cell wall biosynthesis
LHELVDLYSCADFYLELSLHEGFGMQVAEAMACGTTCISSSKGALQEIASEYALFIDDPTDAQLIVNKIKQAYEKTLHLRDNAAQIAYTKKFSWENMGATVTQCLLDTAIKFNIN